MKILLAKMSLEGHVQMHIDRKTQASAKCQSCHKAHYINTIVLDTAVVAKVQTLQGSVCRLVAMS